MRVRLVGLAAASMLLAGPALAAEKLRIGFVNSLSGGAAIIGKHQKDGFDLAVRMLGGRVGGLETQILYGDDERKPDVGRQVATKMVQKDRVHFVAGVIWSNVLAALWQPVTRQKVFLISTNAGWSEMAGRNCNPYFFTTSWNNDAFPESLGKLLNDTPSINNIYLIAPNYQAGKDMITGLKRYYRRDIAGQKLTRLGQRDYQAEISLIRAAKPGALWVFLPGGMGIAFMKQWAASGLADKIPLYSSFTVDWLSIRPIGKAAIGTWHTNYWNVDLDNDANRKFVAAFEEEFGYTPSHYAAQAYDAPFFIDSAVRAVGGNLDNHKGITAALRKADYDSVRGPYRLGRNHVPIQSYYKREVVSGAGGEPQIVTRGVVFRDHADAYGDKCKMKWN